MIAIAVVFSAIGYMEWCSLQRNNRKKRTTRTIVMFSFVLMLGMEAIYICRDRISVGMIVDSMFDPIQRWIFIGK
jgi:membrane-anchored protein YejM (alkaline phosphatase superfamily)